MHQIITINNLVKWIKLQMSSIKANHILCTFCCHGLDVIDGSSYSFQPSFQRKPFDLFLVHLQIIYNCLNIGLLVNQTVRIYGLFAKLTNCSIFLPAIESLFDNTKIVEQCRAICLNMTLSRLLERIFSCVSNLWLIRLMCFWLWHFIELFIRLK